MTSQIEGVNQHNTVDALRLADDMPASSVQQFSERQQAAKQFVDERVRNHETYLVSQAAALQESLAGLETEMDEVASGLLDIAGNGVDESAYSLADWQALDGRVGGLIEKAERKVRNAERALNQLGDPLADMTALESRFPQIRRAIPGF